MSRRDMGQGCHARDRFSHYAEKEDAMKAARWHARKDIRIDDVPDPGAPGPGELILKVACCGICGTDLEEYLTGPSFIPVDQPNPLTGAQAPLTLGHEF